MPSCMWAASMCCKCEQQHGQTLCRQLDAMSVEGVDMDAILHVGSKYVLQL